MRQQLKRDDEPETPAIIGPEHVRDRQFANDRGVVVLGRAAWRKLSPLQAAYAKGQLAGGNERYSAEVRLRAGMDYTAIFDSAQSGSKDSSQNLIRVDSSAKESSLAMTQAAAIRALAVIHSHLGTRDRRIVMMVCGEGHQPAAAVREVCGDYEKAVAGRFREALDALIEAMETSRRNPHVVNLERKL